VWRYLYHTRYGLLNTRGSFWHGPIDWLGIHAGQCRDLLMSVWKNFGYNMLISHRRAAGDSQDLYDAAEMGGDGAGPMRRFFNVTLPLLGPTLLFVGVITMMDISSSSPSHT